MEILTIVAQVLVVVSLAMDIAVMGFVLMNILVVVILHIASPHVVMMEYSI